MKHIRSAPYHPATNGLAEGFVQTFKQVFQSAREEESTIEAKLAHFLISYRNAPHATTGESPAKMDAVKPDVRKRVKDRLFQRALGGSKGNMREFLVGQPVLVRDYHQDHKWLTGAVRSRRRPFNDDVAVGPCVWKRHVDQMWDTVLSYEVQPFQSADTPVRME